MAHTLLYTLGYNAPEHRIVPEKFHWEPGRFPRRHEEDDQGAAALDD